jgi:hypothetical protein
MGAGTSSARRGEISGGASLALWSDTCGSVPRTCRSAKAIFSEWCSLTQSTKNLFGQSRVTLDPSTMFKRMGLNHVSNVCLLTNVATVAKNSDHIWSREETDMDSTLSPSE